ncbi:30871_t:CDS:2, partial [Racocetra persica]
MLSRKCSISSLLNEGIAKPSCTNSTNQRKKVICNCNKYSRSLVDYRMKDAYKNRIQQLPKRQKDPRSSQDITEVEVSDTPASVVDEFTFQPRVRNLALNSSAIEEFSLNSAENEDLNNELLDMYSEDNNFLENSTEFGENLGNNNVFEDYSAPDFDSKISPEPDNLFTDDRFT